MSIRLLLLVAICIFGAGKRSLSQQAYVAPPTVAPPTVAPPQDVQSLSILRCRYIAATDAQSMLQQFLEGKDCRITAEPRTNTVYVLGTRETIEQCQRYVEAIDRPSVPAPEPALVNLQADFLKKNINLISRFAATSGLESAMDEETGLVMLKGKKDSVDEALGFIERLKAVEVMIHSKDAAKTSSLAIKVLWLTNGQRPTYAVYENDPKLQLIFDRMAKQGVKDLAVGMQLISRCDLLPDGGKCQLTGNVDLKNSQEQELMVEAQFTQVPGSQLFTGKVEIKATRTQGEAQLSKSQVQVNIQAETNKYYVLSSAPNGNQHSVFVVQLLDDF